MNRFIVNIIWFGLCLLLINIMLYYITYNIYIKKYVDVNLDYESYLLSDSHGLPLADFTEEYGIFNFSAVSESYFDMLRKVKFLIKNSKVKRIIITVDDHTLSPYRESKNNLDRSVHFTRWKDCSSTCTFALIKTYLVLINPKSRDIVKRYLISKLSYLTSKLLGSSKKLSAPKWDKIPDREKKRKGLKRFNSQFPVENQSDTLTSSLHQIITVCEQNNVKIVGIKYPLTKDYLSAKGDKSYKADHIFHEKNLKVYDFEHLYVNKDEYFKNQDHLNRMGGKKFAKVLSKSVL